MVETRKSRKAKGKDAPEGSLGSPTASLNVPSKRKNRAVPIRAGGVPRKTGKQAQTT